VGSELKILNFLKENSGSSFSVKEMSKALSLSRATVRTAVYDLERNEWVEGKTHNCFKAGSERKYKLSSLLLKFL